MNSKFILGLTNCVTPIPPGANVRTVRAGFVHRTKNQMRVAIQSGCVPKILALKKWSKDDFPPEFQTRQMHSFPIMYNTMGSKVDGLAVRDHFLPKKLPENSYFGGHKSGSTDFRGDWDPNL